MKKIYKFLTILKRFFAGKSLCFKLPEKCDILFIEDTIPTFFEEYLQNQNFRSLHSNKAYIFALVFALFEKLFSGGYIYDIYISRIIKMSQARIVLTLIDNFTPVYRIKPRCPKVFFVVIQNGIRGYYCFKEMATPYEMRVDYLLVFGNSIAELYKKIIKAEIVTIGSFRNNHFTRSEEKGKKGEILFISNYRSKDMVFIVHDDFGNKISWDQYYACEFFVLKSLMKWCEKANMELSIAGASENRSEDERFFYSNLLTGKKFNFIANRGDGSSYKVANEYEICAYIDSTLGLELLGSGKKCACLAWRWHWIRTDTHLRFGFPKSYSEEGPFWSMRPTYMSLEKCMDYLLKVLPDEWNFVREKYVSSLMVYNPKNTVFRDLMKNLTLAKQKI